MAAGQGRCCGRSDRRSRPARVHFGVATTLARSAAVIGLGQAEARDHKGLLHEGEVAMRPVRIITAVIFAAAVAVTGCAAHSTTVDPTTTPTRKMAPPTDPETLTIPVNHPDEPVPLPPPVPGQPPALHFATPEAAMGY